MDKILSEINEAFNKNKEYNTKGFMVINSVLDLGTYYVVSMVPKNMSKDDFFIDGLFKYDKKSKKLSPFCVNTDREKYLKALKKPVYLKEGTK